VRLPKAFRFKTSEVWISRNDVTGEVTLRPKPGPDAVEGFMCWLEESALDSPAFMPERDGSITEDPFSESSRVDVGRRN
jgi:antitoxin VapB